MQAVLLLLGGCDVSINVPSSEFLLQEKVKVSYMHMKVVKIYLNPWLWLLIFPSNMFKVVGASSRGSKLSRRIASLVRFREKRKERCFQKKIRYTCQKEVAQRYVVLFVGM